MLSLQEGEPIAIIESGKYKGELIGLVKDEENSEDSSEELCGTREIYLKKDTLSPVLSANERQVGYIAGPSGSGKSFYASKLIKMFKKMFPKKDIYLFSRTDYKDDPAYKKLKPIQIELDESLIDDPIDITEIQGGSLIIFDDCNTIPDTRIKKVVDALICDIMEVGRKLGIWIILTNHLVNPNEKKFARTVMNEMQSFTFFPKSGSAYQIKYCLKNYFGMSKEQIEKIMRLKSRWVTVLKNYPQCVLYKHGVYLI
jgi:hypothetical protein